MLSGFGSFLGRSRRRRPLLRPWAGDGGDQAASCSARIYPAEMVISSYLKNIPFSLPEFATSLVATDINTYFSPLKAMVGVRVTERNRNGSVGEGFNETWRGGCRSLPGTLSVIRTWSRHSPQPFSHRI